jgi:hypothetical protein
MLIVILLMICTCAYLRGFWPKLIEKNKVG